VNPCRGRRPAAPAAVCERCPSRPPSAAAWAAVLALVLAACGGAVVRPSGPPISLTLTALDGGDIDVAAYRGKVVVLHLFTTWSFDAQADLLALGQVASRGDAVVIGIALDLDGRRLVAPWRTASEVRYLVGLADDDLRAGRSALGRVDVVPTTVVLDRAGRVAARVERSLSDGELPDLIRRAAQNQ